MRDISVNCFEFGPKDKMSFKEIFFYTTDDYFVQQSITVYAYW